MKKNLLGLALLSTICLSQVATAQEYDNRWYLSGTVGVLFPDSNRDLENDYLLGIGVGKRITPNWAIDFEYNYSNPNYQYSPYSTPQDILFDTTLNDLEIQTAEVIARYYFMKDGRSWAPYLAGGVGYIDQTLSYTDKNDLNQEVSDSGFVGRLGVGIETNRMKRVDFRVELGTKYSDSGSYGQVASYNYAVVNPTSNSIGGSSSTVACDNRIGSCTLSLDGDAAWDLYATASVLVKLGDLPVPVVAAPAPTCDTLDSDNDGVNDCNDKCPGSTAGQTIGADGCPVKLTIDLKGVNFDFDKDTLRDDSVVILNEAVAVLAKYPELRVAVDGYTDLCGKDTYNQELSQKRATAVYDFMVKAGIDAGRLSGPTGHGEANPLVETGQAYPGCKNETNRRTELNVQN